MKSIVSIIVEALIFLGIIAWGYGKMNDRLEQSEQNLIAYKGQVEQLELKNGDLITARDSYILQNNQLEESFEMSKKQVRELEKKLDASLTYISKIEASIKADTLTSTKDSVVYKDDKTEVLFRYNDKWVNFNGLTMIDKDSTSNTTLYNLTVSAPLKVGLMDNYKIFVHTDNPYIRFGDIHGAAIDESLLVPKEKRWSIGIQGGIGVNYDLISKQLGIGPYLGVGVHWRIW